ncbi:MAG TPA: hypothetical protein VLL07_03990, partial [Pontiella sp.]|nr:hypothetical protein [Pontiella sp.]
NQDATRNTGEDEGKYVWNGRFAPNAKIAGTWTQLGQVQSIDEFEPGGPIKSDRGARFQQITLIDNGATEDELVIWSGYMLMDLRKNEALRITDKTIEGTDYLFIEAGGFHTKNGPEWTPPLYVFKRAQAN